MQERNGCVWGIGFKLCRKIGCMRRLKIILKMKKKSVIMLIFSEDCANLRTQRLVRKPISSRFHPSKDSQTH